MRLLLRLGLLPVVIGPVAAAEGPELLTNGGFEQVGPEGLPSGGTGFSTRDWGDCRGQARAVRTAALAYRYSDDYHIQDTHRLPRLDAFSGGRVEVK